MAKIPTYDPLSTEARSPLIAGLTTGENKLSEVLDLETTEYEDLPLTEVFIIEGKERLLYQAAIDNKLWLTTPKPVIKVNGEEVGEETYDLDCIGGSVRFYEAQEEGATVTATATGIVRKSKALARLTESINRVKATAEHFKGFYSTSGELEALLLTAVDGDYAVVGETKSVWIYDSVDGKWVDTVEKAKEDITTEYKKYAVHQTL